MWKVCRKTIFPRWHARKQGAPKRNVVKHGIVQSTASHTAADDGRKSGSEDHEKQHAHRHHAFWEDPQYHHTINPTWLETVGLLGTAFAVGLNSQHRHLKQLYSRDDLYVSNGQSKCKQICFDIASLFSNFAWAMPKVSHNYALPERTYVPEFESVKKKLDSSHNENSTKEKVESIESSLKEMRQITNDYIAERDHDLGLKLLNTDPRHSFRLFKSAAQLGHSKAFFNLGLCYETGKGTKVDLKKAAECYIQAALKGHRYALYNIGVYHIKGIGGMPKNEKVGLQFLKKAAGQGVSEAQVYLGLQYLEEEKLPDAFNMFSNSAKQDSVDGKYYLGMCYENGWGVAQNEKMAVEMYIGAAFKGHDDAIFSLGQCYESGRGGLTKNDQLAMALYQIVADKGHPDAINAVNILKKKSHSILKPSSTNAFSSSEPSYDERVTSSPKVGLHESVSSPELRNYDSFILPESQSLEPSPHLDVVPLMPMGEMCSYSKPVLCSNFSQSRLPTLNVINWNSTPTVLAAGT